MKTKIRRPRWIVLGLALLVFIGLLAVEHGLAISAGGHRVLLVAMVLLFYALVALWLRANSAAIMMEDWGGTIPGSSESDTGPGQPDRPETDGSGHPQVAGPRRRERVAAPRSMLHGTHPVFTESPSPAGQEFAQGPLPPQPKS